MFKADDSNELSSARGYEHNRHHNQGIQQYVARVVERHDESTTPARVLIEEDVQEETVIQTTETSTSTSTSTCSREFKSNFHFNSTSFNYVEQIVLDSSSNESGLQVIDSIQQEEHKSEFMPGLDEALQDAEFLTDRIEMTEKPDSRMITRTVEVSVRHSRPVVPFESTAETRRDLLPKPDRGGNSSPVNESPNVSSIFIKKERRVIPINQGLPDVNLIDPNHKKSYLVEYVDESTKEIQRAEVQRQLTYLGVVDADPEDYHSKYASELKDADQMAEYAWDVDEYQRAQQSDYYYENEYGLPELEGDIEALSLIPDLDAVGLGMYKPMLDRLKQRKEQMAKQQEELEAERVVETNNTSNFLSRSL